MILFLEFEVSSFFSSYNLKSFFVLEFWKITLFSLLHDKLTLYDNF